MFSNLLRSDLWLNVQPFNWKQHSGQSNQSTNRIQALYTGGLCLVSSTHSILSTARSNTKHRTRCKPWVPLSMEPQNKVSAEGQHMSLITSYYQGEAVFFSLLFHASLGMLVLAFNLVYLNLKSSFFAGFSLSVWDEDSLPQMEIGAVYSVLGFVLFCGRMYTTVRWKKKKG